MIYIGTDIISIDRIRKSIDRYSQKFLDKIFTESEINSSRQRSSISSHLAGKFAAKEAVKNSDVVITDKWISLHEINKTQKLKELKNFQVNSKLMSLAKKNAIFLHCLPASIGREVTKEVLYGKQSKVYSQAENRICSVKSVIEYCLK